MSDRAIWWVPAGLVAVAVVAVAAGPRPAALTLSGLLVVVAVARFLTRRQRPDGLAVRSWPVDVAVSGVLAVAIAALALTPGV